MIRNNMPNDSLPDGASEPVVSAPPITAETRHRLLIEQAQRVRSTIGSKRSDKLVRLFDFLLESTIAGRAPTEIDIANEVFSTGQVFDTPQDATVRVYVHRLRKSLEQSQADMPGPRIVIPKGDYMLLLVDEVEESVASTEDDGTVVDHEDRRPSRLRWWTIVALVLACNAAAWWWFFPRLSDNPHSALAETAFWRPIAQGERPITVVIGDYYLFAERAEPNGSGVQRMFQVPSINAREDLDIYLMGRPEERSRISDLDMRYVPSSVAVSLADLFKTMRTLSGQSQRRLTLIPASQLTTDILKSSDIVYVGQLSGLGTLLRNPLFQASGFKVGATYDELIDAASGRRFQSDGGLLLADERVARRDFGYLAGLPGPSGNHIVIIAGARDAAVRQMAEIVEDPDRLNEMSRKVTGGAEGLEALYQVRALGNLNVNGQLLTARPLRSRGIWDRSTPSQRFPNDMYEGEGHAER